MKSAGEKSLCPICGGRKVAVETTVTMDLGTGLLIIRHVPAMRCVQCGEEWISNEAAQKLEALVEETRKKKPGLEIVSLSS